MERTSKDEARCVVLTPRDAAMSESLRELLVERSWLAVAIDDPHLAMAELCLEDRARSSRRAWAPAPDQNITLVLDVPPADRTEVGACGDLLAAVTRYLPGASIWAHRDGDLQSLRTGYPENGAGPTTPARPPRTRGERAEAAEPAACEITPEEIEMLLGTSEDDDEGR